MMQSLGGGVAVVARSALPGSSRAGMMAMAATAHVAAAASRCCRFTTATPVATATPSIMLSLAWSGRQSSRIGIGMAGGMHVRRRLEPLPRQRWLSAGGVRRYVDRGTQQQMQTKQTQQPSVSRQGDEKAAQDGDATSSSSSTTPPLLSDQAAPAPPPQSASFSSSSSSLLARENVYTLPNLLTASRLVMAPFVGYCIVHDMHAWSLALFAWAGVSDLLDGWIARRWNLGTVVGTVIDPMADKTLMLVLTASLAVKGALPLWLVALIIGRDVGLGIAAIYYRWISLPPPKTFTRYWDFSLPSAEVRPTTISKYNTFLQLVLMGLTITAPVVPLDLGGPLTVLQYVVAATTVWSGASYVFSKDAVKILSQESKRLK